MAFVKCRLGAGHLADFFIDTTTLKHPCHQEGDAASPYFPEEETEAQNLAMTCPRSYTLFMWC